MTRTSQVTPFEFFFFLINVRLDLCWCAHVYSLRSSRDRVIISYGATNGPRGEGRKIVAVGGIVVAATLAYITELEKFVSLTDRFVHARVYNRIRIVL